MKKPLRVFVVEDDPAYSTVLAHNLKNLGITDVHSFTSGEECLASLSMQPNVILLDFSLEGLNGLDTLRQIRKKKSKAKVAILTALESKEMRTQCLENGASAYLLKGETGLDELKDFLENAMKNSASPLIKVVIAASVIALIALLYFLFLR